MIERRDSWSPSDDMILAQTILTHIRNGSTQLRAFEEAGERLQRTAAACGFRWNATIRHRHEEAISEAKLARKGKSKAKVSSVDVRHFDDFDVQFESCIDGLLKMKRLYKDREREIEQLKQKLTAPDHNKSSDDIQLLMSLLNNARRMGLLDHAQ